MEGMNYRTGYTRAMTRTYVQVIALEVAILVALWFFGRMFS